MSDKIARLNEILASAPVPARALGSLANWPRTRTRLRDVDSTVAALVTLLNQCVGSGKDRMALASPSAARRSGPFHARA